MNQALREITEKIDRLPEHFSVATKITRMLDDIDVDIEELTKIISLDQSLTSMLLKLCNSAHYGFSKKIASVKDAVAKLGFKTVKSLIFVAVSQSVMTQEVQGYDLAKGELWKNSIACAVYSRHLARKCSYKDPEIAFTAGLLRDIGKLMIHEYVGVNYNKIVEMVSKECVQFIEAETKVLGFDHSQIGSVMAVKWNFPTILTDVIKYHHNPGDAIINNCQDIDLISIVHIADSLATMLGIGLGGDGMMYSLNLKALDRYKIPVQIESIENLLSEVVELNSEIESLIGIANEK